MCVERQQWPVHVLRRVAAGYLCAGMRALGAGKRLILARWRRLHLAARRVAPAHCRVDPLGNGVQHSFLLGPTCLTQSQRLPVLCATLRRVAVKVGQIFFLALCIAHVFV